jgi:hypothetical protein
VIAQVFDEEIATKTALEEWDHDSVDVNGVRRIDHKAFHNALFELADIWTPEVRFLRRPKQSMIAFFALSKT